MTERDGEREDIYRARKGDDVEKKEAHMPTTLTSRKRRRRRTPPPWVPPSHHPCRHPLCSTPNIDRLPAPSTSPCLSPPATTALRDPPPQSTTLSPRRSAATSSIFQRGCTATFPFPPYTPGASRMRSRFKHLENPRSFPPECLLPGRLAPPRVEPRPKNRRREGLVAKSPELSSSSAEVYTLASPRTRPPPLAPLPPRRLAILRRRRRRQVRARRPLPAPRREGPGGRRRRPQTIPRRTPGADPRRVSKLRRRPRGGGGEGGEGDC